MKKSSLILLAISVLGIIIENLYFTHMLNNHWTIIIVSVILVFLPALYAILSSHDKRIILFLIFLAVLYVKSIYPLYSKDFSYIPPEDPIYHWQVVNLILEGRTIPFGKGVYQAFYYTYYPSMDIIIATVRILTGVDQAIIIKVFPMLFTVFPFIVYMIIRTIFKSEKIAFLGALIYTFAPMSYGSCILPFSRNLGMIFFYLFIFSVLACQNTRKSQYFVASLIFLFTLSMTHHLTLYVTLGFIVLMKFLQLFPKFHIASFPALSLIAAGIVWPTYVAYLILTKHIGWFLDIYIKISWPSQEFPLISPMYSVAEQIFIGASIFGVCLIAFLGLLRYLKRDVYDYRFLMYTSFFGLLFLFLFLTRNLSRLTHAAWYRYWDPLFVSIGPLVGCFIFAQKQSQNMLFKLRKISASTLLIVVILICFVVSAVDTTPRELYNFNFEEERGLITNMRGYGERVLYSTKWHDLYASGSHCVVGDEPVVNFLRGYFGYEGIYYYDIYTDPLRVRQHIEYLKKVDARYVFVDYLLATYDQTPGYLIYVKKVEPQNLSVFATVPLYHRTYDNDLVQIYYPMIPR